MKKKLIHMDEKLFKIVEESAKKNDRSTNKEITALIKKGLRNEHQETN